MPGKTAFLHCTKSSPLGHPAVNTWNLVHTLTLLGRRKDIRPLKIPALDIHRWILDLTYWSCPEKEGHSNKSLK